MILQPIYCIHCHGTDIVKFGKTSEGKQRYKCRESLCNGRTFILNYSHFGRLRGTKQQIVDMAMNGSRVRDPTRVLHVSPNTVTRELKKRVSVTVSKPISVEATESLRRLRWKFAWRRWMKSPAAQNLSWMRCGAMLPENRILVGCGTPLTIIAVKF